MSRVIDLYYCKLRDRFANNPGGGGISVVNTSFPVTGDGVGNPVTLAPARRNQMLYHDGNGWVLSNTGSMIVGDLSGQNTSTGNAVGFGPLVLANLIDNASNHTAVGFQTMEQATGAVFGSDAFGYQSLRRITDGVATRVSATGLFPSFGKEASMPPLDLRP